MAEDISRVGEVGVEDRLRVIAIPREQVGRAEIRSQAGDAPEESSVKTVDQLIDEGIAHHLELLGSWRRNQGQGADAFGMGLGQF